MLAALPAGAETIRLATWHADFSRKGPGLLLRDILKDDDPSVSEAVDIIAMAAPDVLLLTAFDHDHDLVALNALAARLLRNGAPFPHVYAALPNSGMPTGLDLDGDGRLGGPRDAQGYGRFSGAQGLALLSRLPITDVTDYSTLLWRDVPDSAIAADDPGLKVQRLSSTAHWVVRVQTGNADLTLGAFAATPPVFDGPEDRNGRRNRDEVLFWAHLLAGRIEGQVDPDRFILMGNANLDPERGQGERAAITALLTDHGLTDPLPGLPTVAWDSVGEMRVSYVLPSQTLPVMDAGVMAPGGQNGPHRLVWVDVDIGPTTR